MLHLGISYRASIVKGDRGREGYGRREKKGREAGSLRGRDAGKKFNKASVRYLLLLIIQSKTQTATYTS